MDLNPATVLNPAQLPVDIQVHLPHTSLNMGECRNKDHSQPGQCRISNLLNFPASKEAMADHLHSLQLNMEINRWLTEVLRALVDMVVVNKHLMPNSGAPLLPKASETASAAIKDEFHTLTDDFTAPISNVSALPLFAAYLLGGIRDISQESLRLLS